MKGDVFLCRMKNKMLDAVNLHGVMEEFAAFVCAMADVRMGRNTCVDAEVPAVDVPYSLPIEPHRLCRRWRASSVS